MVESRVALIVPACQPGWEEMENLRGNLRSPTIKVTLVGRKEPYWLTTQSVLDDICLGSEC